MDNLIIVKFGGSVLCDGDAIRKVAEFIKREINRGLKLIIVVSAVKGETDRLLSFAKQAINGKDKRMIDDIIAMGEKTSARLFVNSLKSVGINAVLVDPESPYWPIITDEEYGNANPILGKSEQIAREKLLPLVDYGKTPVVCGFIGRSIKGNITTLGRGGSDTTAVLLGRFLNADEIVLVKDVDGVYSADPDDISDAVLIEEMSTEDLYMLSAVGAKIIHNKALRYKLPSMKIKIISMRSESLLSRGTIINGRPVDLEVLVEENSVSMITIISNGNNNYELIRAFTREMEENRWEIRFVSFHNKAIILYLANKDIRRIMNKLHRIMIERKIGKAITAIRNLGCIIVRGHGLERISGVISKVVTPLSERGINVFGINTIASSIHIFLASKDVQKAAQLIKDVIKKEV